MPRLDPEVLPDLCKISEDDRRTFAKCWFNTGFPIAKRPPFATTDFVANDTGNSNPKFVRSSIYKVPSDGNMISQASIPFTLSITPFAELDSREVSPPIVDFAEMGPVRCQHCLAYISPFFEFIDSGRSYKCPFCQTSTPTLQSYFSHLGRDGRRIDLKQRPELRLGSYEFVATKQYCEDNVLPNEPAFVFLIDVSYQSVSSGLLRLLCEHLPGLLKNLPREFGALKSGIKIALATYDQTIHFYDLGSDDQPRMCVLPDVNDVFVPFVEGFFVDFETAETNLAKCLSYILTIFSGTQVIETILGPPINVALEALNLANRNGKIFVFHTTLPTFEAPGRLTNREDPKALGTNREKTVLTEATSYYRNLGEQCVESGVCVDLFLFPNAYIDVASIAPVSHLSGGSVYMYQYFDAKEDGRRFLSELQRDISRQIGLNVRIRVRTSPGVRPTSFYGSLFIKRVTEMQTGAIDSDKSIQVEIKHDYKLNEQDNVYIQVATLFTSCSGQRRLRIHNIALSITSEYDTMFKAIDQSTIFVYLLKHAERTVREKYSKEMQDDVMNRCVKIMTSFRENCSQDSLLAHLVFPESLELVPLIGHCVIRSRSLCGGIYITADERAWMRSTIPSMTIKETMRFLYPNILPLTSLALDASDKLLELPKPVRASVLFLERNEAYLIENGFYCVIWLGSATSSDWIRGVFDAPSLKELDTGNAQIPLLDTPQSRALRCLLIHLFLGRARQPKFFVSKPNDKFDLWVKQMMMVEDRCKHDVSYSDFLCDMHREITYLIY